MTLVAAFRCSKGGILLCADREENDGYFRREVDKIYKINTPHAQFFIAGSGPSAMVTKVNNEINEALFKAESKGSDLRSEHKEVIEACLQRVHKQYAANLKGTFLELLLIFAPLDARFVPTLYRTDHAALIPEATYWAYGSGKPIADYFADRIYEYGHLDKDGMKIIAAFILREAEKAAVGVGLGADIWFIHEGEKAVHILSKGVVKEIQDCIPPISDSLWFHWKEHITLPPRLLG